MHVLVLRHHTGDHAGFVGDGFRVRGADLCDLLVTAASAFPDPAEFDAVIVLGAADAVYDEGALSGRVADEVAFLRGASAAGVPVLGICFGAQALTVALGGKVEPMSRMEIGWYAVGTDEPDLVEPGPWLAFHGDRCLPPPGTRIVARTDACVQAFTLGPHLAIQFHPEVDAAQLEAWLQDGSDDQVAAHGIDGNTLLAETAAQEPAARRRADTLVAAFLRHAGLVADEPEVRRRA